MPTIPTTPKQDTRPKDLCAAFEALDPSSITDFSVMHGLKLERPHGYDGLEDLAAIYRATEFAEGIAARLRVSLQNAYDFAAQAGESYGGIVEAYGLLRSMDNALDLLGALTKDAFDAHCRHAPAHAWTNGLPVADDAQPSKVPA